LFACNDNASKKKEQQIPSTENQGVKKTKLSPREIDSIESLKKKKSKRFDTLKPSVAGLDLSEE